MGREAVAVGGHGGIVVGDATRRRAMASPKVPKDGHLDYEREPLQEIEQVRHQSPQFLLLQHFPFPASSNSKPGARLLSVASQCPSPPVQSYTFPTILPHRNDS